MQSFAFKRRVDDLDSGLAKRRVPLLYAKSLPRRSVKYARNKRKNAHMAPLHQTLIWPRLLKARNRTTTASPPPLSLRPARRVAPPASGVFSARDAPNRQPQ